ncbi:MAG: lysylphosphatidylglycerol synthase transmembrane domain-containing protein, partial [Caldimicrobium sp.]
MNFKKVKSFSFLFLRFLISFGILFYLFKKSDLVKLKETILRINILYYFLAFFCVMAFQSLVAYRWKVICSKWSFYKKFFYFFRLYLMGFSLNTLFPGIVAGDTLRGYFLVKDGLEWKKATFSVIFDRAYGLLGIMIILAFFLPYQSSFLPSPFRKFLFFTVYGSLFVFLLLSLLVKFKYTKEIFQPLSFPFSLKPLFIGFIIQILFVLQFVSLGTSMNLNLGTLYFVIIPIISFLSALPLSISGLGV